MYLGLDFISTLLQTVNSYITDTHKIDSSYLAVSLKRILFDIDIIGIYCKYFIALCYVRLGST